MIEHRSRAFYQLCGENRHIPQKMEHFHSWYGADGSGYRIFQPCHAGFLLHPSPCPVLVAWDPAFVSYPGCEYSIHGCLAFPIQFEDPRVPVCCESYCPVGLVLHYSEIPSEQCCSVFLLECQLSHVAYLLRGSLPKSSTFPPLLVSRPRGALQVGQYCDSNSLMYS